MNIQNSINRNKPRIKAKRLSIKAYSVGLSVGIVVIGILLTCKYYLHYILLEGYVALWIQLLLRAPLVLLIIFGSIAILTDKKKKKYSKWMWISSLPALCLFIFYDMSLPYLMDLCTNKTIIIKISNYNISSGPSRYDFPYHLKSEAFTNKLITSMPGKNTEIILSEKRYNEIHTANKPPLQLEIYPYSKIIKKVVYLH